MYSTIDIWPGIYSSHQRCLEALQRLDLINEATATELSHEAYIELLQYRLNTARGEKKDIIQQRLDALHAQPSTNGQSPAQKSKTKSRKLKAKSPETQAPATSPAKPQLIQAVEKVATWATSQAIIFLTLVGALSIQIHHVAHLVSRVSQDDSLVLGYIFGSVSEITALLLTIHKAKKSMLIIFAFVQCWINILYYCQLPDLMIQLTLSALIAFVIYSYSELYSVTQQKI